MSYVVESGASEHRRSRRRRTAITILIVLVMLFSAFWYAYSYYRSSADPAPPTAATCTSPATTPKAGAKPAPLPANITVNVYNATSRNGLAAKTASELGKRGYKIATVANDPLSHTIKGVGEVRYGPAGQVASKVLGANLKGLNGVRDSRTDGSLDFVIGDAFKALGPVPKGATARPGC